MRRILLTLVTLMALLPVTARAQDGTGTITVSVSYRERIALPPDAELDLQLIDLSRQAGTQRIASQRFAMTGVPMKVMLAFDPRVVRQPSNLAVSATILAGDAPIFKGMEPAPDLATPLGIMLRMVDDKAPTLPFAGIQWAVTEIAGEAWPNDDPATLIVDDGLAFSIFGGCNRFVGRLDVTDTGIAFPENFAGTLMACPDTVEAAERRFLSALRLVAGYARDGSTLELTDAAGATVLRFAERPE
ncbi:META domain-containing protein [Thetidibacter halocola]|uniref:META domain-containing protein n=1 Tax=Thetidibacter halocola TaxID=2827239 RepID=A0A8J7WD00_9RHOB|nr:META domain-containing protein [Thetidibacter halocola]MBS0124482.1 META domain-containing protein [Thetidibacter halocola]